MTAIDLRPGSARDIAIVDTIMQAAFDPQFGEAWTRSQCLGMLALPGVRLLIAERRGEPVGFALNRAIVDEAELLLLATHPSCRRRGVGRSLIRALVAECEASRISAIHLEVRATNDAVSLYIANDFHKVGERSDYYRGASGQTFDAWTFRRSLRDK